MWTYKQKQINSLEDIPEEFKNYSGVIYLLEVKGGTRKYYLGQKKFYRDSKRLIGERELESLPNKRGVRKYKSKSGSKKGQWIYYEPIRADNGFMKYLGSSEVLKEDIKNGATVTRHILMFVEKPTMMNYWEQKLQFCKGVLESEDYYNDNIGGRFYKNWVIKNIKQE